MHHAHFAHELPKTRGGDRWAYSDEKVKAVLLAAFPRFEEGSAHLPQRLSAQRWMKVIYLYFRQGLRARHVAEEIGSTESAVRTMVRNIKRVHRGQTANHAKPRGRGRDWRRTQNAATPNVPAP